MCIISVRWLWVLLVLTLSCVLSCSFWFTYVLKYINLCLQNQDRLLWKLGTLPPGLITFWNKTLPLNRSWHVLGLGYNPHVSSRDIERAAVIHYNGNMKPWLEIGLPKFRNYWSAYLDYDQPFLRECNINPWRKMAPSMIHTDITNSFPHSWVLCSLV